VTLSTTETSDALYATGMWLLDNARTDEAALVFRTLLLSHQDDERGWLGLGACHERKEQLHVARVLYALGTEHTTSARCPWALALVLRAQGHEALADTQLDLALERAEHAGDASIMGAVQTLRSR
jgi:hypothetical protein